MTVEQSRSILDNVRHVITEFHVWIVHDLPEVIMEAGAWLFQGTTSEVTIKLAAMLVVLTCLFAYSFRSPADKVSAPLSIVILLVGALFWGAATVVVATFLFR